MNLIDKESVRKKAGQLFIIGIHGTSLDGEAKDLLEFVRPGGVCLFSRNIRNAAETRKLLADIRSILDFEPILCLDQEGGLVDRLRRVISPMPAPSAFSKVGEVSEFGKLIAEAVRRLGFNLNFAPVVDVSSANRPSGSNGLYSRTFGNSPDETIEFADAFLTSMQEAGCVGCLKHFPGLGAAKVDSHEELPVVDVDDDELSSVDLEPFRRLIASNTVAAVMVAHAAYPQCHLQETDQNGKLLPSSLSYNFVTQLLRQTLGFTGLIFTDDLEMGAIQNNYGIADACTRAIGAGNDMLAICADAERIRTGFGAVVSAIESGEIVADRLDESLARIASFRSMLQPPLPFSEERFSELSSHIDELKARLN